MKRQRWPRRSSTCSSPSSPPCTARWSISASHQTTSSVAQAAQPPGRPRPSRGIARDVPLRLGRHLDVSIRTGVFCSYQPEREQPRGRSRPIRADHLPDRKFGNCSAPPLSVLPWFCIILAQLRSGRCRAEDLRGGRPETRMGRQPGRRSYSVLSAVAGFIQAVRPPVPNRDGCQRQCSRSEE